MTSERKVIGRHVAPGIFNVDNQEDNPEIELSQDSVLGKYLIPKSQLPPENRF